MPRPTFRKPETSNSQNSNFSNLYTLNSIVTYRRADVAEHSLWKQMTDEVRGGLNILPHSLVLRSQLSGLLCRRWDKERFG